MNRESPGRTDNEPAWHCEQPGLHRYCHHSSTRAQQTRQSYGEPGEMPTESRYRFGT
ncbi:hypothetical protein DPMN_155869 [Dreissena polymorpha]|uniref:Uncharacterized protein n=1 Tax=Dreissena polymorpha TaxID=45954 RepID=A0A9D4FPM7_DREPO|nr:hypothetical protein DPMN_155869 [Dreissena polymorpha]